MWLHMVVWLPLFAAACILLLRPVKGATLGWMMRLGFTGTEHGAAEHGGAEHGQGGDGGVPPRDR
jgi:hypothetical protein